MTSKTKTLSIIKNRLHLKASQYKRSLVGNYWNIVANITKKPISFKDQHGFMFLQYPDDSIKYNWSRESVTDANNVIRYISQNVKSRWTCIDVGANIGAVSVALWKKVGVWGKVISIEPDPSNIDRMKSNLILNNCNTNFIEPSALTNKEQQVQLRRYPGHNGWQTLGNPNFAKNLRSYLINVPSISFNTLVNKYCLDKINLIKIDAEGSEFLILKGMSSHLERRIIDQIIFEVNPLMLEGMQSSAEKLISLWEEYDYTLHLVQDDGTINSIDTHRISNQVWDCLAIANQQS